MKRVWTTQKVEELGRMRAAGLSNAQIAHALNVTTSAIDHAMSRYETPPNPHCWDDAKTEKFIAAWKVGKSVSDMMREFDLHRAPAIYKRVKRLGLTLRKPHREWSPEEDNLLRRLWQDRWLTLKHMAEIFGRTEATTAKHARVLNLPRRSVHVFPYRYWTKRDNRKLRRLWFTELSLSQIAVRLRRTTGAIGLHRQKLNLPRHRRSVLKPRTPFQTRRCYPPKLIGVGP